MRPRGLSSSSPSRTYVGQVAVQNPQWVQVRSTFSDSAVSGSASCSAEKSVRTDSAPFDHAPGIENSARVETLLDTSGESRNGRRLRFEDRDSATQRWRPFDQGGVTRAPPVRPVDRGADSHRASVISPGNRGPQEPASPVEIPAGIEPRDRFPEFGAPAWRDRNSPNGAISEVGEGYHVADRPPEHGGGFGIERSGFAIRSELGQQPLSPEIHRRGRTLEAKRGNPGHSRQRGQCSCRRCRYIDSPRNLMWRGYRSIEAPDRRRRIEPTEYHGTAGLRLRQHLYRHFLERGEGPVRAGHQFAEVVPGDVLDDFATCFEDLAATADAAKPKEMVARRASLDPARSRKVADERAAQSASAGGRGRQTEKRTPIWRLECEHLPGLGERRVDFFERRRGGGGQD